MEHVMLKIHSKQKSCDGEENTIEMITEGKLYEKSNAVYLVYKETELSGMEGSTTTVRLRKDEISMRRFGSSSSDIVFQKGKWHKSNYGTPYGNFHIIWDINKGNKGTISIDYHVNLQGLVESSNQLHIKIL
jgi:uncharacterized beta-barrel protein YwiB (DUF1934 family)